MDISLWYGYEHNCPEISIFESSLGTGLAVISNPQPRGNGVNKFTEAQNLPQDTFLHISWMEDSWPTPDHQLLEKPE